MQVKARRVLLASLPAAAMYGGFLSGAHLRLPSYWFAALGLIAATYTIAAAFGRAWPNTALAFFSWGLLMAGFAGLYGPGWFHMAYIPYVLLASAFFPWRVALASLLFVPLLEARHLIGTNAIQEELAVLALAALTAAAARIAVGRRKAGTRIKRTDVPMIGPPGDAAQEISSVMRTAAYAMPPGSMSLFLLTEGELRLGCSTEDDISLRPEGLIHDALAIKRQIVSLREEPAGPGYNRPGTVRSLVATPVMDGAFAMGLLAADSDEEKAFSEADEKALALVADQIAGILRGQRIHSETERAGLGLRLLLEEGTRLTSTLELDALLDTTADGLHKTSAMDLAFFLKKDDDYELVCERGLDRPLGSVFNISNTLAEMAAEERHLMYIPDLKGYSLPPMPLRCPDAASALIIPLTYKNETLGLAAFVSEETSPLSPHQTELLQVLCNQAAISLKNAMLHDEIRRMAVTDGLTGLYNHKKFHELLNTELERYKRTSGPMSLLIIDIDFFKRVNDTYGHQAGDIVLKGVADIISNTVRDIDIAARQGGEEFAALLVNTDRKGSASLAERLRSNVMNTEFLAEGHRIRVTASIGLASCPEDAKDADGLVSIADKALYTAKETGRNRVIVSGGPEGQGGYPVI
jgi:diguanylate cyclase (GGDEF)-like protein